MRSAAEQYFYRANECSHRVSPRLSGVAAAFRCPPSETCPGRIGILQCPGSRGPHSGLEIDQQRRNCFRQGRPRWHRKLRSFTNLAANYLYLRNEHPFPYRYLASEEAFPCCDADVLL